MEELHDEDKCSRCRKKKIDCDICWDGECYDPEDEKENDELED